MLEVGVPVWTEGQFKRASALDDLGLESVGAGLLRRLIPGVVQTTPNAGYYAFYPYLLSKWEEISDSPLRSDFKPFYRRQEAAYALACLLHEHRGGLAGIQGSIRATETLRDSGDLIDVAGLADRYMDSAFGGYGLFYARVLEDMRLTKLGLSKFVDHATDVGKQVATAFAQAFEGTRYFRQFFESDEVPREVLEELGSKTCLCTIPGRTDHVALLNVFFGDPLEDAVWEDRRRTRVESLSLFLEFHRQRPAAIAADLLSFRIVIAQGAFADGTPLLTPFDERANSWRAYQLRECETLVLTTIWSRYLWKLDEIDPVTHAELRDRLVAAADWAAIGFEPDQPLSALEERAATALPTGAHIVEAAQATAADHRDEPGTPLANDLRILLAIAASASSGDAGFAELRDEGGPGRWSLAHLREWIATHRDTPAAQVLADLLDELHFQHVRVALSKVSPTDSRDPFCFSDDDGLLRLIRSDEPFWTGARYGVANHLLWTLGLLTEPAGDTHLTDTGLHILAQAEGHA